MANKQKKLFILTVDMNCLKQKMLPGPDRSYKELPRDTNRCPEMTGAARLKQELPGATKRYQKLPEAQDVTIATKELTRTAKSFQDVPRTTKTCEMMTRAVDNA